MCAAALLATLMVGQIQPTYRLIYVTPQGDTLDNLESADGLEVHVRLTVTRSGSAYVYTYTLTNDSASSQALFEFEINLIGWKNRPDKFAFLDSVQTPPGWWSPTLMKYFEVDTSLGTPPETTLPLIFPDPLTGETAWVPVPPDFWKPILRAIRFGSVQWTFRLGGQVPPGDSISGFRIFSRYPPDHVHWFVSGFSKLEGIGLWTQPPENYPESLVYVHMEIEDSMRFLTPYGDGKVYDGVGPGDPVPAWPAAYGHLEDRLERVDSLGWFLDSTLKRELDSLLTRAYEAYKRRQYLVAFHNLSLALGRLNMGRGSRINDLGYFVLYYRFLEAREKLPGSPVEIRRISPR